MALFVRVLEIVTHATVDGADGLRKQEQQLVDEVRSQIVESSPAHLGAAAPAGGRAELLPGHLDPAHAAEPSFAHELTDCEEVTIPAAILEDCEHLPRLPGGDDHAVAFL